MVSKIIIDCEEAQSGSLRFIIYNMEEYYKYIIEKNDMIIKNNTELKNLLLSAENKRFSDDIENYLKEYMKYNEEYYTLQQEKEKSIKSRSESAMFVTKEIDNLIELTKTISKSNKDNYMLIENIFTFQQIKDMFFIVRVTANKYQNKPTTELENTLKFNVLNALNIIDKLNQNLSDEKIKSAIEKVVDAINNYSTQFDNYKNISENQSVIQKNQKQAALNLLNMAYKLQEGVDNYIQNTVISSLTILIIIILAALTIGLIVGIFNTRIITKPLALSVKYANSIKNGDLTKNIIIEQKDEIGILGNSLNQMNLKLKEIVSAIISGSYNIVNVSQQLSSASQQLSQGANEQASSVEEISSTMEQMTSNIEQNNDNAIQTESISLSAQNGIVDVNQRALKAVEANKLISEKITIINDIAFQTNILALNAAVEAARAGEHGKGFAVVAAEVRKLAERSKIAAEEIVELALEGLKYSEESSLKLSEMLPEIEKTTKLVQEIAAASGEQTNGANQVNNALQQLNNVTQQTASSSEELASSAEEMSSQADQLKEITEFFNVDFKENKSKIKSKKTSEKSNLKNDINEYKPVNELKVFDNEFKAY